MRDNSSVLAMRNKSQVKSAFDNSLIKVCSPYATVQCLKQQAILVCQDCHINVQEKDDTATIIDTETVFQNTSKVRRSKKAKVIAEV